MAVSLQPPHVPRSPSETFRTLSDACREHGIDAFDVYGDFGASSSEPSSTPSFVRTFERSMADELGFDDAVFMPSGVMAQSIALLAHRAASKPYDEEGCFACHESSHLLLHEQDAYRELLGMGALVLPSPTTHNNNC